MWVFLSRKIRGTACPPAFQWQEGTCLCLTSADGQFSLPREKKGNQRWLEASFMHRRTESSNPER